MIYKIVLSNTKDTIPVAEKDLVGVIDKIAEGNKLIITKEGLFNPSYLVGILPDYEDSKGEAEHYKYGFKKPYLESPFAKLLSNKMTMLPDGERTKAQEEASKEERKLK